MLYTVCLTRYRTRHLFNNSDTNEHIATKFEQEYVRCVRNEKECVCNAPDATRSSGPPASQPGSVASGTRCILACMLATCLSYDVPPNYPRTAPPKHNHRYGRSSLYLKNKTSVHLISRSAAIWLRHGALYIRCSNVSSASAYALLEAGCGSLIHPHKGIACREIHTHIYIYIYIYISNTMG